MITLENAHTGETVNFEETIVENTVDEISDADFFAFLESVEPSDIDPEVSVDVFAKLTK